MVDSVSCRGLTDLTNVERATQVGTAECRAQAAVQDSRFAKAGGIYVARQRIPSSDDAGAGGGSEEKQRKTVIEYLTLAAGGHLNIVGHLLYRTEVA